jgi:hypothetical protein
MPQKRRKPSKEAGYEYLTVLVPSEFRAALEAQAEAEGRTLSDVVRRRLLQVVGDRLSPRARAVGRLGAILFHDLAQYSPPEKTAEMLMVGAKELLAQFNDRDTNDHGTKLDKKDIEQAENFAKYLWLKLKNAQEPTFSEGARGLITDEQRELLEIQKVLLPDDARRDR